MISLFSRGATNGAGRNGLLRAERVHCGHHDVIPGERFAANLKCRRLQVLRSLVAHILVPSFRCNFARIIVFIVFLVHTPRGERYLTIDKYLCSGRCNGVFTCVDIKCASNEKMCIFVCVKET